VNIPSERSYLCSVGLSGLQKKRWSVPTEATTGIHSEQCSCFVQCIVGEPADPPPDQCCPEIRQSRPWAGGGKKAFK
jgi:hypothetical protein